MSRNFLPDVARIGGALIIVLASVLITLKGRPRRPCRSRRPPM
jgi:hypothetical protein